MKIKKLVNKTEVLGSKKAQTSLEDVHYHMIHYMARFQKKQLLSNGSYIKKHMLKRFLGRFAFREFLKNIKAHGLLILAPLLLVRRSCNRFRFKCR